MVLGYLAWQIARCHQLQITQQLMLWLMELTTAGQRTPLLLLLLLLAPHLLQMLLPLCHMLKLSVLLVHPDQLAVQLAIVVVYCCQMGY